MKVYIARQPIFNEKRVAVGYELLYRDSEVNRFNTNVDGTSATSRLVSDALMTFGLNRLTHGRQAYINMTEDLLLSDFAKFLNPHEFIIEILESVQYSPIILDKIYDLKKKGFTIALDDYTGHQEEDREALLKEANMIKVDFSLVQMEERIAIAQRLKGKKVLLAEKVETKEDFEQAKRNGYTLFQGYYFARPQLFAKSTAEIFSGTTTQILCELAKPAPKFEQLVRLVQQDVSLSYKLMQRINTLLYYRGNRITSVRHAMVYMGIEEIYRWIVLVMMRSNTEKNCDELVRQSLVRGVFMENLARKIYVKSHQDAAFMTGMFSMIDVLVDDSLPIILAELRLPKEVSQALIGENNVMRQMLDCIIHYEQGNWEKINGFLRDYNLDANYISGLYWEAVRYADVAFDDNYL